MAAVLVTSEEKTPGKTRFVCMSDTHSATNFPFEIPNGDVFIHAGDLTAYSSDSEYERLINWLGKLPHAVKLVIAGNHDHALESNRKFGKKHNQEDNEMRLNRRSSVLTMFEEAGIVYLEQSTYILPAALGGFKVFGSPYAPPHLNGAFMHDNLKPYWKLIPADVDILITHTPPYGVHDETRLTNRKVGCKILREKIDAIKPKVSVFGHIHEGYGHTKIGNTLFINASTCNYRYQAIQPPVVFDL